MVLSDEMKSFALRIAKADRRELSALIRGMKFEDALKRLDGHNLTIDPITIDGEMIGVNTFFDVTYKHISTSIFMTSNGRCELYDSLEVHVDFQNAIKWGQVEENS